MAGAIYIPGANRTAQWFYATYPGTEMPRIRKLLLHTTEGGGWPAYSGGSEAPQATYDPSKHQWRQHLPLNRSGRALVDPSSTAVRENRDEVVQVEIVCSCDQAFAKKNGILYVGDIDDQAIADLGGFLAFMHREWQVPLVKAPLWLPYPRSYGNSAARMSSEEYDAFAGVLGHQHASGNVHGDPGAIPIDKIMAAASVGAAGDTEDEDVALTDEERQGIGKAEWLADQFAKDAPKQIQLNKAAWLADAFAKDGHVMLKLDAILAGQAEIKTRLAALEAGAN